MALDKVIDSTVLDNILTSIADAIREKAGTSDTMAFPDGFVEGINGISGGDEDPLVEQFRRVCTRDKNTPITSIPEDITSIGSSAFYQCTNLALTSLPSGVTSIGNNAFYQCTRLALTSLPSGVTSIPYEGFMNSGIKISQLPPQVTTIGAEGFRQCNNIKTMVFPASVSSIGSWAFFSCDSLTSVTFEGTPKNINNSAFQTNLKLTTINVPWAEGAVANAPWGATNATINYNYTGE